MELKERISTIVKREVDQYGKSIRLSNGRMFNQHETVKRINCYINDTFFSLNDPDAIFWNLSTSRITHFAKNIDLDTKDLNASGKGETNFMQAWILRMKFDKWKRENKLSILLNELSEGSSTYGSSVWKLFDDKKEKKLEETDLLNLYFDPAAKSIRHVPVVEIAYLDETEIRSHEGGWEKIEDILKNAEKEDGATKEEHQSVRREIWERWGEVMGTDGKAHYTHFIGAGYGEKEVIAFEEECEPEDMPYYDFHIGRYRGRWLRVGVVERLFKLQERVNAVVNQNAEATMIASLLLLRTNDANTSGNVLQGAMNGEIINSADLQQIGIDNRAFSTLLTEIDRIERKADLLCLTPEIITGDMTPNGVPFRSVATIANSAKSAFGYIKQSIGESIGYLLVEEILPSTVKHWNRGEMIDIADNLSDINLYDDQVILAKKIEYIKNENANGRVAIEEDLMRLEEELRVSIQKSGRSIEIPKGFFNFEYGISVNVTGEGVDKAQQNDAYSNVILWKTQNPQIVNDPYFRQYCENNNITPVRMTAKEIQQQVQGMATGQMTPRNEPKVDKLSAMVNAG